MNRIKYLAMMMGVSISLAPTGCANSEASNQESAVIAEETEEINEETEEINEETEEINEETNKYEHKVPYRPGEHRFHAGFVKLDEERVYSNQAVEFSFQNDIYQGYLTVIWPITIEYASHNVVVIGKQEAYINTEYVLAEEFLNPITERYETNQIGEVITKEEYCRIFEEKYGYEPPTTEPIELPQILGSPALILQQGTSSSIKQ